MITFARSKMNQTFVLEWTHKLQKYINNLTKRYFQSVFNRIFDI